MGLVASVRPSTFDMAESETTVITCGALNLTATKQRTRCECSILTGLIHAFRLRDQVFAKFATYFNKNFTWFRGRFVVSRKYASVKDKTTKYDICT